MRLISAGLAIVVIGACGKGSERPPPAPPAPSAPSAAAGAAAPTQPPRRPEVPAAVALPQVGKSAVLDAVPAGPLVVGGDAEIVLEGSPLVPLRNGAVAAADLAGTATDLRIPKVVAWATAWHQLPIARGAVVSLAVKPSHPAAVVLQVIASFASAEQRDFALLARGPEGVGALPVRLPAVAAPGAPAPAEPPVDMVLSFAGPDVLVWSLSGQEGTLAAPRAVVPVDADGAWVAQVRGVLGEVVQRRWAGRARPVDQTAIVIMVDPPSTAGALAAAVAAVRHDATGRPLFPDVRLSPSFAPVATRAATAHGDAAVTVALDEAEVARFAEALLASGDGDTSADDLARRRPGSDLAAQLDEVREAGDLVALGGGTRTGGGDLRPASGHMLAGGGPAPDGGPAPGITITSKTQLTDTSLTADVVLQKVTAAYMSGLKRCYRDGLTLDPQLHGAVTLGFTVNETGRATDRRVGAMTPALDACIAGQAANWRFPVPKDSDGEPSTAEFKLTFELAPR